MSLIESEHFWGQYRPSGSNAALGHRATLDEVWMSLYSLL